MTEAEVRAREAFFETATFLLDRELQRSRIAPRRHDDEGHGAAADSLEVSASNTLKEFKTVCDSPESRHWDAEEVRCELFKLSALVATERLLSDPVGISHEHLRDPGRHVRIRPRDVRSPPESFEIRLPDVPEPEIFLNPDGTLPNYPERHYDRETVLLMQECSKADATKRRTRLPWYNSTSFRLRDAARRMLDDMHSNPAACRMHPMRTKRRLLKMTALVVTDCILSRESGFPFQTAERPERHLRIRRRAGPNSPESFELRLLHFNAREN